MHRGHDHDHPHHHGGVGAVSPNGSEPGLGHNHSGESRSPVQWQTVHLDHPPAHQAEGGEPDLDLVEAAFVEAFMTASDPTSFLRLAQVPFEARSAEGDKLALLRVEIDAVTDVGSLMPHLGGNSFRYDPLPAAIVSRRRKLAFAYFDGTAVRSLSLAEVRTLPPGVA